MNYFATSLQDLMNKPESYKTAWVQVVAAKLELLQRKSNEGTVVAEEEAESGGDIPGTL
jgi:hypothetical protein